jgi:hypothetical protein
MIWLTRADRPPWQALVSREDAPAAGGLVEGRERVHEIAALLGVLQTHGEVIARHHSTGPIAEGLEEVGRDRRSKQLDQDLADSRETLGLTHAGTGVPPQKVRASSARSAPPGTGSIGPTTVRWRIRPSLSMRKIPCSCAVMAW